MAKYCGMIGFSQTVETAPGVWTEQIVEKEYYGDVLQNNRRWQNSEGLNQDLMISNRLSLVANDFASQNLPFIKYAVWNGNKFSVTSVEYSYPRFILSLGGVYNG